MCIYYSVCKFCFVKGEVVVVDMYYNNQSKKKKTKVIIVVHTMKEIKIKLDWRWGLLL